MLASAMTLGQAARVMRDEDSGICFRELHGFCSTGSMISWLPSTAAAAASHLFTGASDPIIAGYKRFTFPPPDAPPSPLPNQSLELWRAWRGVALNGGLGRSAHSAEAQRELERLLTATEAEALAATRGGDAVSSDEKQQPLPFATAVARELEALRVAVPLKVLKPL